MTLGRFDDVLLLIDEVVDRCFYAHVRENQQLTAVRHPKDRIYSQVLVVSLEFVCPLEYSSSIHCCGVPYEPGLLVQDKKFERVL